MSSKREGPIFNYQEHVHALYEGAEGRFHFQGKTASDVTTWQQEFRPQLRDALGLTLMEEEMGRYQPRAERFSSEDLGDFIREKWYLWVEPTVPLPFWLLLPPEVQSGGRLPLVLTPHGHNHPDLYVGLARNEKERRSLEEGERDIAVQAVKEGYITIAPTTRGFGETANEKAREEGRINSCRDQLMHCLLVGRTPIGERVYDISRLIDWAEKNLPIDMERIAITGNSGGGTTSVFAPACDTRITVAVPSSYFCTFADSIGSIHHCECNYVPGILQLGEMSDVTGLIAPRPFCAIAGQDDPIFPIAGVKKSFAQLKRIYEAADAADRCQLYIGSGGHRYYKAGSWPFIQRWFADEGHR